MSAQQMSNTVINTYQERLQELIDEAYAAGVVLSIVAEPQTPLRMGNYWPQAKASVAHHIYRKESK